MCFVSFVFFRDMRRRDFLSVLTLAGLSPAVLRVQGTVARAAAEAWPQFRGDAVAHRSFVHPPLSAAAKARLDVGRRRRVRLQSGRSSTALFHRCERPANWSPIGLTDGKLRWKYKAGESIGESSPAVADGRVYIGDL